MEDAPSTTADPLYIPLTPSSLPPGAKPSFSNWTTFLTIHPFPMEFDRQRIESFLHQMSKNKTENAIIKYLILSHLSLMKQHM
jgi:hypothetical protein